MGKTIHVQQQSNIANPPQLDRLKKETEEWRGKYLRALADYQNLEKRIIAARNEEEKFAAKNVILKLLPVLDVLEKAGKAVNDQGLELALKHFRDVLKSEQVEKIEVMDKKFDPLLMECVEVVEVPSDKEDKVVEEVRAGFMMHSRVIRVAQVKMGKKNINQRAEELAKEELRKGDYM